MPKYYVVSGDLRIVMDRMDPYLAAMDALKNIENMVSPPQGLAIAVRVSERGFEHVCPSDTLYSTGDMLEEVEAGETPT